jgi:hypothetical protein
MVVNIIYIILYNKIILCVNSNDYYTVIGISTTRNKISCNVINFTIYLFGDNT